MTENKEGQINQGRMRSEVVELIHLGNEGGENTGETGQ